MWLLDLPISKTFFVGFSLTSMHRMRKEQESHFGRSFLPYAGFLIMILGL